MRSKNTCAPFHCHKIGHLLTSTHKLHSINISFEFVCKTKVFQIRKKIMLKKLFIKYLHIILVLVLFVIASSVLISLFSKDLLVPKVFALTNAEAQYQQANDCTYSLGSAGYLCYAHIGNGGIKDAGQIEPRTVGKVIVSPGIGPRTVGKVITDNNTGIAGGNGLSCDPVEDGKIDESDFNIWKQEYIHSSNTTKSACMSPNKTVDLLGFQAWKNIYVLKIKTNFP